jgi:putative transposase
MRLPASLGVGERSVWRWLAAGEYGPGKRSGWRMTPEAVEAFYRCGGRPTAAWRLLQDEGAEVPSRTVFCDALKRDVSPAERAYARHGEDGRRRYSVYRRWEPQARNEVWEADHDKLEISALPLRGTRLVRPWLTVIEDGFSRLVMGWALSLYPMTAEVLVAIREAIVIDEERGPWGGLPELIRFDSGREFLATVVKRAAGELGCAALPAAPYSPHQKGKVERLLRTIGEGVDLPAAALHGRTAAGQREALRPAGAADLAAAANAGERVHRRLQRRAPAFQTRRDDPGGEVDDQCGAA